MSKTKRAVVFLISCATIFLIMSAVLGDESRSVTVFSTGSGGSITILDAETLLPIPDCKITVIGSDKSYITDNDGIARIYCKDASLIACKKNYAPHLLMHYSSEENCFIRLMDSDKATFTAEVSDQYASRLISRFLPE